MKVVGDPVVKLTVCVTVSGRPEVAEALELPSTLTTEYSAFRTCSGLRCSTLSGKASVDEMSETMLKTESVDGDIANYVFDSSSSSSIGYEDGGSRAASR
jgi:hypothetical protein